MLLDIHSKLPMRSKKVTRDFYIDPLDFEEYGNADYGGYEDLYQSFLEKNISIHPAGHLQRKPWE